MKELETGLIITSIGLCAAIWFAVNFRERAIKAKRDLYFFRLRHDSLIEYLGKSELKNDYLKMMNAKFIKLNNSLLDQMDKMVDKRKFNGTKHAKR